ncbi:hypothetical protein FAM21834_00564 [Lentilactobacillus parabuchneri]|jgi:hypothetical protein|uniref:Fucose-binding lectin II n=2 Tax=Lentilactobacillus parabuchneri TaxID=152331 RepID=A0A1X1FGT5_9LACO|nr:fucose-binding lectin II [Lentilactobacillus parabuchneri]APR06838.1 hypothetical protein FAM21731_00625 [Lentilactobacillus parabuchneri]KRM46923.1 hypothetical protein FC51_GL001836 [Lentilactobacillus parabuchneri DSM 5707 = NBRC 107865]MBW0222548.1 fucose-binding lectin II [Lentilactobacillus parabuchneri]MBW0245864.1 fucose-binding lectin II [Lentilactobacillus parabuchneri]MBW0264453.1 fucose-binding lectin II [Lentilactobacillus parabuchneri]
MKHIKKLVTLSMAGLLLAGAASPLATVNAASVKTASTAYQQSKTKASYQYAKKMLSKNRTGFSGKTSYIFSKKAYPTTGAVYGYSDFLLGLKGLGYKFTKTQRTRVANSLILNKKSTPADLATAIIAIKAVGLNPQKLHKTGAKKSLNLVAALYRKSMTKQTVTVQSQALIALSTGNYQRPSNAQFSKAGLGQVIVKNQLSNKGWAYNNQLANTDSDTTAMAVTALARSKSTTAAVKSAIAKGQTYLKNAVYPSGAFGYAYMGKTYPNANSTAEAIIAFSTKQSTLKYVNGYFKSGQTASPLKAMLGYVRSTGSIKGAATQTLGVGQVNLANAAYRQALKHQSVYTIK